ATDYETWLKCEGIRAGPKTDGRTAATDDRSCIQDGRIPAKNDATAADDRPSVGNSTASRDDPYGTSRDRAGIKCVGNVVCGNAERAACYGPGIDDVSGAGGTDAGA